jgi:hypothetical protein
MSRLCLYYRREPERDRWFKGDRFLRPLVRRVLRGRHRPGGLDKVFINLCLGLDRIGVPYRVNLPFRRLQLNDRVAVLGIGRGSLRGYDRPNPVVAGIGLMTHPSEWPTLFTDYPVVRYLQHSAWCDAVYRRWFGDRCDIWPVGIDTSTWAPDLSVKKQTDFLLYDKIRWNRTERELDLLEPIRRALSDARLTFETIRYGDYEPDHYRRTLARCHAMLFLVEHESQGIAYQEALSAGVPVLAWDPGWVVDPERFKWKEPQIPATSVPYFDERCGLRFRDFGEFQPRLLQFQQKLREGAFSPRDYVVENLSPEKSALRFVEIVNAAQRLSPHDHTP